MAPLFLRKHNFNVDMETFIGWIRTFLRNPDSRNIFLFLLLNLAFMFVQLLYGYWANSLGLISDAIHMAFDCLALLVGLIAAVMAKWPPSRRDSFGYARVEVLAGFANAVFLCLISFSIIMEAVQRLVDPPQMNTDRLLLISTLGLLVNLVGLASFGHHHHGHAHHDHDHHHHDDKLLPTHHHHHHSTNMQGVFLHLFMTHHHTGFYDLLNLCYLNISFHQFNEMITFSFHLSRRFMTLLSISSMIFMHQEILHSLIN